MAGPTRGVTIVIAFALLISVFAVRVYAPSMPIATPNSLSYKLTSKLVKHSPYTELIMVACHSTLMGIDHTDIDNEENWSLAEMQRGQLKTYIEHIEKGVELAAANPHAILMFSGGQTRVEAGPRSEAYSYWVAAEAKNWWGHPEVKNRTVVEEFARDSMENVLFSLCRFREVHSAYPRFLTVVSYSYKKKRFTDLHRAAVAWPLDKYHFVGVDPEVNPYNDQMNIDKYVAFMTLINDHRHTG
eukprot:TRINITY_DN12082_c0_g1_i1.p1 TRINITY_DN12082_c0_g1~~TRINITY_DN12082_c0_g1_i1.p1  ORF type:complete len:280 (+),score=30.52 TRINITY_DN12082_c0_g1_i1:114-842(+)